ncbi:MAG: glutamate--cysteine ligase, partial [Candidatus Binatia bacterium]
MCDGSSDSGFPEAIASIDELEAYFHGGCKPRKDWKVGVEYEKPVVYSSTGEAVEYDGTRGIGSLLARMLELYSWSPVYENGKLIALRDGTASITLEPGGQFELSGEVCDSLHCADDELKRHVAEITRLGQEMGLSFLALGATPKTSLERMPWMPKGRYDIMREAMRRSGLLGHRMMQQTATVQANFDYSDERDASRKMRLAMALAPALVAMSANSPVIDGRPTGYRSYRAHVWTDTDPARCGVLPFVFDTDN